MSSINQGSQLCGHCKTEARWFCPSCVGAPGYEEDEPARTTYCNAACREADWESHKEQCSRRRARKILYRAGDTIKQVFHLFLKHQWWRQIYKVEREKDAVHQYEGEPIERCDTLLLLDSPYVNSRFRRPFPAEMFSNEQEKESALAYLNCHYSILYMHGMVESMLEGVCSMIEEVCVDPKNDRLKIITVANDGTKDFTYYRHEVYRVTTLHGERYVLDLTSSQYGYYEPVTSWNSYENMRVDRIEEVLSFGDTQINELQRPDRTIFNRFFDKTAAYLNTALLDWETENIALTALLRLPDQEFVQQRMGLYAQIGAGLERVIPEIWRRTQDDEME